jgi:plasmid stabilization system protein ParE
MSDKKIIAVVGATGAQGGGLARAILDDPNGPFRVAATSTIEIVRILHDRMDLQRHVPFALDESTE